MSNKPLRHACIGYGAWGRCDAQFITDTGRADIVAVSDEDPANLREAAECYPGAAMYTDWRELLEERGAQIDSVGVCTRDHMHAPVVMSALRRGKHVYCQKPLTRCIAETRALTRAAEEVGVVTQMGIQIHAHEAYRTAVSLIRAGLIGRVSEVHAWSQESSLHPDMRGPVKPQDPPPDLHWDQWLGVAPERPFNPVYLYTWNGWMDFGNGLLGNVGCHIFDPVFTALDLGPPHCVQGGAPEVWTRVPIHEREVWPHWQRVRWDFDPTPGTSRSGFALMWYDGGQMPPASLGEGEPMPPAGSLWVGEKGKMLLPHIGMPTLLPRERFAGTPLPVEQPGDHYREYVDACLGEGVTSCGFEYAGPLTEAVLLGSLAVQFADRRLGWDASACRVTNHEPANHYLMRPYRSGWETPGLSGATNPLTRSEGVA